MTTGAESGELVRRSVLGEDAVHGRRGTRPCTSSKYSWVYERRVETVQDWLPGHIGRTRVIACQFSASRRLVTATLSCH